MKVNLRQKFICFSRENKYLILMAMAALLVAFLPLFTVNCVNGHDVEYHLLRIEALKAGILAGKPFLRVNMLYFGGRGYASSMFYPDFLLYIPALLRCAGVSINASYHIFIALCIALSFGTMYYAALLIGEKYASAESARLAALVAGVIYVLAQYHIDDIYTRSAVGEFTAMIFIPMLMYGMFEILCGEVNRPGIMVAGFVGTILCHTTTTVFFIGIYALSFIVAIVISLRKNKKAELVKEIIVLAVSAVLVILLTAFYWLPMLEQFMDAAFQTNAGGFDMNYEKLLVKDIFRNANPGLGAVLPVMTFALSLWVHTDSDVREEKKELLFIADFFAVVAVIFALGSTGILPWGRLQRFVGFIQFPWRLFIIATPMMAVACGLYILIITNRRSEADGVSGARLGRAMALLVAGIMMVSAMGNIARIDEGYYSYSDDYYEYTDHTGNVIGGEWLPVTVTDRNALKEDCNIAVASDGSQIEVTRTANALSLNVPAGVEYVDVPFIYYKGYAAVGGGNEALPLDGSGENGSVRVYPGGSTSVTVSYKGTTAQTAATAVSVIFFAGIAVLAVYRKKRGGL